MAVLIAAEQWMLSLKTSKQHTLFLSPAFIANLFPNSMVNLQNCQNKQVNGETV